MFRTIRNLWMLAAVCVVGAVMAPVLAGFAPLGGDPELMYQPIKAELARSLGRGPAAVLERSVRAGRAPGRREPRRGVLSAQLAVLPALGRRDRLSADDVAALRGDRGGDLRLCAEPGDRPAGSAMAAVGFALCGFQAVHAAHEPFYHLMPYLPLCLLLADRYAATGRLAWLAGLAMAWGAQITLGHFQIQMWTGGLVCWWLGRALGCRSRTEPATAPPRRVADPRLDAGAGLGGGDRLGAIAADLGAHGGRGVRPSAGVPHQLLVPAGALGPVRAAGGLPGAALGAGDGYWGRHGTTAGEACALRGGRAADPGLRGLVAAPRDRPLAPWRLVGPLSLALATMPGWWPDGFHLLLNLPGLGTFRAAGAVHAPHQPGPGLARRPGPGSLDRAAAVLGRAGPGDRLRGRRLGLVDPLGDGADFLAGMGAETIVLASPRRGWPGGWASRRSLPGGWDRLGAWAPVALAAVELGVLFFVGPVWWVWDVRLPDPSPVLRRLAELTRRGLIAGRLLNLPVDAGLTTAFP